MYIKMKKTGAPHSPQNVSGFCRRKQIYLDTWDRKVSLTNL